MPSIPPVTLTISRPGESAAMLSMTGWEMAPHTVNGERTFRIGATIAAASNEHFYGLGQYQEGKLDLRGRTIECRHDYDAPAGETVCVPVLVTKKGYAIVWDNSVRDTDFAGTGRQHALAIRSRRASVVLRHCRRDYGRPVSWLCPADGQDAAAAQSRIRVDSKQTAPCDSGRTAGCRQRLSRSWLAARRHGARLVLLDADGSARHRSCRFPQSGCDEQRTARRRAAQPDQRMAAFRAREPLLRFARGEGLVAP